MKTLKDLKDLKGKRILVRVDFNVPLKNGKIDDDNRIIQALPTINYLVGSGARVILFSHLGKIDYKKATPEELKAQKAKNNLKVVAERLSEIMKQPVVFSEVTTGKELDDKVAALQDAEVLLVQNTRYEKGEEKNDPDLSASWAKLGDVFVMDAFGSAHRAHASTYGIPELLKKDGKPVAIGFLVEKEVHALSRVVNVKNSDRPYLAILGGLKVSDKIKVIDLLLEKCDKIIIGGAMAYTFQRARGFTTGNSPVEESQLDYARECLAKAKDRIVLPLDAMASDAFSPEARTVNFPTVNENIPEGFEGLDIGPKTIKLFQAEIAKAKMVFWNGPMGVFEQKEFIKGTAAVCEAIASLKGVFSVIGGGDSASAAKKLGYFDKFSHVSTGGGASLEMIENNGHLPGIDIIGD
ncbi:MAG: phosphoglycerate kinase [Erysipelotrichaceae bacterium]|jgi:phosphoglycerate kinase|nr:phosphoglycerate kinase [Erysipelotrichaceae bacterium]